MTKTYRYEFTIRSPEDVAFRLLVDLEQLEARYQNTYPVAVESASLRAFVIEALGEAPDEEPDASILNSPAALRAMREREETL